MLEPVFLSFYPFEVVGHKGMDRHRWQMLAQPSDFKGGRQTFTDFRLGQGLLNLTAEGSHFLGAYSAKSCVHR